jgi:hypothetical protein
MTTNTLRAACAAGVPPGVTRLLAMFSDAVDRFAESRMRRIASECERRHPRGSTARHRHLMRLKVQLRDQRSALAGGATVANGNAV